MACLGDRPSLGKRSASCSCERLSSTLAAIRVLKYVNNSAEELLVLGVTTEFEPCFTKNEPGSHPPRREVLIGLVQNVDQRAPPFASSFRRVRESAEVAYVARMVTMVWVRVAEAPLADRRVHIDGGRHQSWVNSSHG